MEFFRSVIHCVVTSTPGRSCSALHALCLPIPVLSPELMTRFNGRRAALRVTPLGATSPQVGSTRKTSLITRRGQTCE